jgi:hypothetical protein
MLVREVKPQPGDVLFTPGDIHFDAQDDGALTLAIKVAKAFRMNTCCLIGDTFDSIGISRHGRPARNFRFGKGTIKAEARAARPYIETIDAIVSSNRGPRPGGLHVLTGNHENWWRGVQDEFPGLLDHVWSDAYGDLFDGWHCYAEHTALKFGPLLVAHGHRLRGSLSINSAYNVLRNYPGQNTLYGHTHRIDACITPTFKYGAPVDHGAWTIGHLRDIATELKEPALGVHAERHKQGFALTHFFDAGGELRFKVDLIPIDRTSSGKPYCVVGGVYFEGER